MFLKKSILLTLYLFFVFISSIAQVATIKGKVISKETNLPINEANVKIEDYVILTNENGEFSISDVKYGTYILLITHENFEDFSQEIVVSQEIVDLGNISLTLKNTKTLAEEEDFYIKESEITDKKQNISTALIKKNDPILDLESNLGFAYFSLRGYKGEHNQVYINGICFNNPETEQARWSDWGGLNDAMRNQEASFGVEPQHFAFGRIGNLVNINTRPTGISKQNKFTAAAANRSYNQRFTYTYSSGLLANNWAFVVNGSYRLAKEGYVEGTFYESAALSFAAEKRFNKKHSLVFTTFASPYKRGSSSPATKEVYELTGSNYYNPNWGWQGDKKRNAKVRSQIKPVAIVNHYWKINEKAQLSSSLAYIWSKNSITGLNWYDAPDPRPDYYRYLPSYQTNPQIRQEVANAWKNSIEVSQINWNRLYQINYLQNLLGEQAKYIVEQRNTVSNTISFHPRLKYAITPKINYFSGVELERYVSSNYKTINDLLGGEYWIDVDQFAEREFSDNHQIAYNDLNNPNQKLKVGDKFGYNYNIYRNKINFWNFANLKTNRWEPYFGFSIEHRSFQRQGKMLNGRYPENSYGKSKLQSFLAYSAKAGTIFKINGKNFITLNSAYLNQAPQVEGVFKHITISNNTYENIKNEEIITGDLSYLLKTHKLNIRLTLYQTMFYNQTDAISFYHDDLRTFVDYVQTGINKVHQGTEFGYNWQIISNLSWSSFINIGNYVYTSRPLASISYQNASQPDTTKTVYTKYFFESTPQFGATTALRYNGNRFWWISINANYIDKNYISFNPERRTTLAIENLGEGDPLIDKIITQEMLPAAYTFDLFFGKSWKVKSNFISLMISVNNILNNKNIITSGFEQMRFDFTNKNVDKFPPKYFYAYGRTYFVMLSYKF